MVDANAGHGLAARSHETVAEIPAFASACAVAAVMAKKLA
jgi:hypothetical protein